MDEGALAGIVAILGRDPVSAMRILLILAHKDADLFSCVAPPLLRRISGNADARFLLAVLRTSTVSPPPLLDPAFSSPGQSECLAALLAAGRPGRSGGGHASIERLLRNSALDTEADSPLLPALLLHHSDPRIRSTAVAVAARTDGVRDWGKFLRSERDPRVRANAIEALWNSPQLSIGEVFAAYVNDPEPRIAANALVGLHRARRPAADVDQLEALVRGMLRLADPRFVASAAWAMGVTGDVRYIPVLEDLVKRPGSHLLCAIRAMRVLRALQPSSI
ncbi:MAG TPA: hypothetical protein VHD76_16755 [Bryobacteraceae bacterium]|nr:hypothetical protein [Bryobacteraceae bacterium]